MQGSSGVPFAKDFDTTYNQSQLSSSPYNFLHLIRILFVFLHTIYKQKQKPQ